MMTTESVELRRCADALERIATVLEKEGRKKNLPISLNIDGRTIATAVARHTLMRAVRGSSTLVGGTLLTGEKDGEH